MPAPSWSYQNVKARWKPIPNQPTVEVGKKRNDHYAPIVNDLIAAIEEDREPFTSVQAGRDALEMVQSAFEAAATGSRVAMPLANRAHPLSNWSA